MRNSYVQTMQLEIMETPASLEGLNLYSSPNLDNKINVRWTRTVVRMEEKRTVYKTLDIKFSSKKKLLGFGWDMNVLYISENKM